MVAYVVAIVLIAFIFDFINGFHDSANSIATIVGTRVLSPLAAVVWAATFNFAAAFTGSLAVAKAIGGGMIEQSIVDAERDPRRAARRDHLEPHHLVLRDSLELVARADRRIRRRGDGAGRIRRRSRGAPKWVQTLSFIVISPLVGLLAGYILMVAVFWIFRRTSAARVDRFFRPAQLVSSALLSYSHGGNDAQKTMGVIVGLLVSVNALFANETGLLHHFYLADNKTVPHWVEICAYTAISLGTLFGGWRIVHTMGTRITKLRPVGGFCAETGGAAAILIATHYGIPVSTTHTITGSIVGVGATQRLSAVRWGLAGRIVWAWVLTIPAAGIMAAISYRILALAVKL